MTLCLKGKKFLNKAAVPITVFHRVRIAEVVQRGWSEFDC